MLKKHVFFCSESCKLKFSSRILVVVVVVAAGGVVVAGVVVVVVAAAAVVSIGWWRHLYMSEMVENHLISIHVKTGSLWSSRWVIKSPNCIQWILLAIILRIIIYHVLNVQVLSLKPNSMRILIESSRVAPPQFSTSDKLHAQGGRGGRRESFGRVPCSSIILRVISWW